MTFRYFAYVFWLLSIGLLSPFAHAVGPTSGQWYDRTRAGHGLDLNRAGGTLFGTFYTYAGDGSSQWLWLQTPDAAAPSGTLTRSIFMTPPVTRVGRLPTPQLAALRKLWIFIR